MSDVRSYGKSPSPFSLLADASPSKLGLKDRLGKGVEHLVGLRELGKAYASLPTNLDAGSFIDRALAYLDVRIDFDQKQLNAIPASGPLLVVANHPFGAIEGLLLAKLLLDVRPDTKILANFVLSRIPEMRDLFIPVNPFGGKEAAKRNTPSLRTAHRWLKEQHALLIFPAGEVSSLDWQTRTVTDPQWHAFIGSLAIRAKANVLPVFVHGRNSIGFHLAGLLQAQLRTVMLPRELLNKKGQSIRVGIGQPLLHADLQRFDCARELTDFLRLKTYLIGATTSASEPLARDKQRPVVAPHFEALADAEPASFVQNEIAALKDDARLLDDGDFVVYCARAAALPHTLRELGRLREISFRAVGEGSGKARDVDLFDSYYLHLLLWDKKALRIAGAYRLAPIDDVVKGYGIRGLYTHSLFHYTRRFLGKLEPGVELGRSFVSVEYQRSYAPLLLLWKGIGAWLLRHPRYKTLFGPVSISADYSTVSRHLLIRHLLAHYSDERLRPHVRPRRPYTVHGTRLAHGLPQNLEITDLDVLAGVVASLEGDSKGIPVLIRQYLKLGGRVVGFNVDEKFNNCIDGLIVVDLTKTEPKILQRYMGREGARRYLAFHRETASLSEAS